MSTPVAIIKLSGDLLRHLPRLTSEVATAAELKRVMDEQDQDTVRHIMERYLTFPSSGPTTPEGLRAITNRLRGNLRAVPATITPGAGVAGGVSNNVFYAKFHELGAEIPPHDIFPRTKKALRFIGKNGAAVICKHVHFPGARLPARAPMQKGIADRLPEYVKAFETVIQRLVKS